MSMPMGPPRPDAPDPAGFVAALRGLRGWSGTTYRELAARSRGNGEFFPASTIATALGRSSLPRAGMIGAITRACGLDEAAVAEWIAQRNRLAAEDGTHVDNCPHPVPS